MKKLSVVPNLCIGCRECELMCSLKHRNEFNPAGARIRIELDEKEGCYYPVICRHCDEPACAEAKFPFYERAQTLDLPVLFHTGIEPIPGNGSIWASK